MVGSVQAGRLESWLGHAYDPVTPNIDYYTVFNDNADWMSFYCNVKEELLPKIPKPRAIW
jgi:hypothetical protein